MQMPPVFTNCMAVFLNKLEMRCLLFTISALPAGPALSAELPRTSAHVIDKFAGQLPSRI